MAQRRVAQPRGERGRSATATPLAWDSKNFGTFLLLISLYLPAVALVCLGLCIWAGVERKSPRARSIVISLVVMLTLIGGIFWALPAAKDELRFLAWLRTHKDALQWFADRDSVMLVGKAGGWQVWKTTLTSSRTRAITSLRMAELRSGSAPSDQLAKSLLRNGCVVESISSRLTIVRCDKEHAGLERSASVRLR
jgi:hypothetical protein